MQTSGNSEENIVLSDDKDDNSCTIMEEDVAKKTDEVLSSSSQDEDLTFSRGAVCQDVRPHARYDCPIYPFTPEDSATTVPVANNHLFCDWCFCYICDNLASLCDLWCLNETCHCNSHNKSEFWRSIKKPGLVEVRKFNLPPAELDSDICFADDMLQSFGLWQSTLFMYIKADLAQHPDGNTNQQDLSSRFEPMFESVTNFLDRAEKHGGPAAAIMYLGAAEKFMSLFQMSGLLESSSPSTSLETIRMLLNRVISSVQTIVVMDELTPLFVQKLQDFFLNKVYIPAELMTLKNSLCIRSWKDALLLSVLRGKWDKKDVLTETISVVRLRTELLQRQGRYTQLCRYLQVVHTHDPTLLEPIKDLIPFFLCKLGQFSSALTNLFPKTEVPNSRLTPTTFLLYLRIFETASAPDLVAIKPEHLCYPGASWAPIKDAVPLTMRKLIEFGLQAQRSSKSVYSDSLCWTSLLKVICAPGGTPTTLPAPTKRFLNKKRAQVSAVLSEMCSGIHTPQSFFGGYPSQALLLLVIAALATRIQQSSFGPSMPIVNTLKENMWAFQWLCDSLDEEHFNSFILDMETSIALRASEQRLLSNFSH